MEKILLQDWAIPRIPEQLEDCYELPHYLVNKCHEHHITTTDKLIKEFEKSKSQLLHDLESISIAKIADMFIGWGILSSTACTLAQHYSFSKN